MKIASQQDFGSNELILAQIPERYSSVSYSNSFAQPRRISKNHLCIGTKLTKNTLAIKPFTQLFAEQVKRTPDKTAVVYEDQSFSYRSYTRNRIN